MLHFNTYLPNWHNRKNCLKFGTTEESTTTQQGEMPHNCCFGRDDVDFNALAKYFDKNFDNKTPVIFEAASDGSESYMFAISLINELGEDKAKKISIYAKDKEKRIIEKAKTRVIGVVDQDIMYINSACKNIKFSDYFEQAQLHEKDSESGRFKVRFYRPKKILQDMVKFEQGDVLEDTAKILESKEKAFIFVRNVAHIMPHNDLKQLGKNLRDLPADSLLVLGKAELNNLPFRSFIRLEENFVQEEEAFGSKFHYYKRGLIPVRVYRKLSNPT